MCSNGSTNVSNEGMDEGGPSRTVACQSGSANELRGEGRGKRYKKSDSMSRVQATEIHHRRPGTRPYYEHEHERETKGDERGHEMI